jgi:hypothetical protein
MLHQLKLLVGKKEKNKRSQGLYRVSKNIIFDAILAKSLATERRLAVVLPPPTQRHEKQKAVKHFLIRRGLPPYKMDGTINNGRHVLSKPDFIYYCMNHCVIIECDEYQHRKKNRMEEITRMINIAGALYKKTIFIRFNPDEWSKGIVPIEEKYRVLEASLRKYLDLTNLEEFPAVSAEYLYYNTKEHGFRVELSKDFPLWAMEAHEPMYALAGTHDKAQIDKRISFYTKEFLVSRNPIAMILHMNLPELLNSVLTIAYDSAIKPEDLKAP